MTVVLNVALPRLVLASASPARLNILRAAGIDADVLVSGVDESRVDADRPDVLCGTLARMKARAVAERLRTTQGGAGAGTLVLGCDSVLSFDGEILGKPADPAEACRRWRRMRGKAGVLYTGHCLIHAVGTDGAADGGGTISGGEPGGDADGGSDATIAVATVTGYPVAEGVAATTVRFAEVSDAEIAAYVATGEPLHVAGAFTIDGIGGTFVESIDGDPGTVIGLSLPLLRRLLAELGVPIYHLWRPALHPPSE